MKLPAAAYSAEVATSLRRPNNLAASYGVSAKENKKSRSAIPSRDGGGSASRLDVIKPLACRGPRKDRDDVTGNTVDVAITGFVP